MSRVSVGRIQKLYEQAGGNTSVNSTVQPATNGGVDLGTAAKRYGNLYCQDLNLANERGNYTVVEEEEYLSIRNNKTGKLYKFVLEEIEAAAEGDE